GHETPNSELPVGEVSEYQLPAQAAGAAISAHAPIAAATRSLIRVARLRATTSRIVLNSTRDRAGDGRTAPLRRGRRTRRARSATRGWHCRTTGGPPPRAPCS